MAIAESKAGLDIAASGLGLLTELIKIAQEARRDKEHPLAIAEILNQLPVAAHRLSGEFVRELQKLRQDFLNTKIDMGKNLNQLQSETSWWRFRRYRLLREFHPRVNSIVTSLSNFYDDIVAVAHCKDADSVLATTFVESLGQKRELEAMVNLARPIGQVLENLIAAAQDRNAQLADMINGFPSEA